VGQASVPQAAPRRRARGDRTRAVLTEAAIGLFRDQGVEATSVDEITAAAAVAKGTFYVHFQRKEDVLLERAAQLTLQLQEAAPADTGDAVEALRALAARLAALLSEGQRSLTGRTIRELIGQRSHWLRVLGDRPTLGLLIEPIVHRGQDAGQLRADQSPHRLAHALTSLWLDNVIGWAERPETRPLARDLELALDLFLDGAARR
jgi:TetR/AcrR family transcriptional regulator, cholesterol catabolism regulator